MTQRQEIIERLNGLELKGGSHEMLSAICKAVLPHGDAWTLRRCWDLRDRLVRLLGEADAAPCGGRITDELRREAQGHLRYVYTTEHAKHLLAIADRIDTEHEAKVAYWQGACYKDGYDEGFASADDWLAQHEDAMAEHGWYRALDADSDVIKASDELFTRDGESCGRVTAIGVGERKGLVWVLREGKSVSTGMGVLFLHHHRPPTVEDVLREFADKVYEDSPNVIRDRDAIVADFAKRLRLSDKED